MENIFTNSPIIINVVDGSSFDGTTKTAKKIIKRQAVWTNTDDKKTASMWRTRNRKALKKKYGTSINYLFTTKIGGDADADADADDIDLDSMEITFDDDDLDTLLEDDTDAVETKKESISVEKKFIVVDDIYILPEDKISEFKKKIYIATGIPPYRQHLWYEFKEKAYPLSYKIIHETPMSIDIRALRNYDSYFEGIPVDTKWYDIKDHLRVVAIDEYQLLSQIYYRHGVTNYFVTDLNDFINPVRANLDRLIKKDQYSIELIYYSFIMKFWPQLPLTIFGEYVRHEEQLFEKYPDLAPRVSDLKKMYTLETKIVGKNYTPIQKDVPVFTSITYSAITVSDQYILPGSIIYLRNLFDEFELSSTVPYIVCNLDLEGRPVTLSKNYKNHKIPSVKVPMNAILFNISSASHSMSLIINKKGNYKIESSWREDQHFTFSSIYKYVEKYVKPIIEKINSFGKKVTSNPLTIIRNDNSTFTDISISMFWKFNMSANSFNTVKKILESYIAAGLITQGENSEYYFLKGMHKYEMARYKILNPMQNQYSYLTDSNMKHRHDTLITKRKRLNVLHRFSDIKIEFTGLKEQEYTTFYVYILRFLNSIPKIKGKVLTSTVKKLKQLKEKDPALYEFKKIYNSSLVYSKICQQQKQPVMYNEPGKNRTKYWNFTTDEPAYYGCPNPEYPYVNFITHAHPKNFCIPCCYKLPPSKDNTDKKGRIYNICMNEKKYTNEKKTLTKSRYVMAYGKDIEVGRLSRLPENTLEPLFYDTFSATTEGKDDECVKDKGFYIYGVSQNIRNVSRIGLLFSVTHSLGKNIMDFIEQTIQKIKRRKESWKTLLNGTASAHFATFDDLITELNDVFIGTKFSEFEKWNELFMDIARLYWDLHIVHFLDKEALGKSIDLQIPGYIQHPDDYKSKNRHLLIIERNGNFYPIYIVNKDAFFTMGSINSKLHEHNSSIIATIRNIVDHHIKKHGRKQIMDLHLIKRFVKNTKYNIKKQYINAANFCYGVLLQYIPNKQVSYLSTKTQINDGENYEDLVGTFNKQNSKTNTKGFFVPIAESYHKPDKTPVTFDMYSEKDVPDWARMKSFMACVNSFIKDTRKDSAYLSISVENWLLYKDSVIGFRSNSYNYLITPIPEKTATNTVPVKFHQLRYHPIKINKMLISDNKIVKDTRHKRISSSLYKNYLYDILIIELINILDKQKNNNVRNKVKKAIASNASTAANDLFKALKKFPADYKIIQNLLAAASGKKQKTPRYAGIEKKKFDIGDVMDIIDNSIFEFDKQMMSGLKSLTHKQLVAKLMQIFGKITSNTEPDFSKTGDFPNMLMSCEVNHPYCKNKKLMIKKDKLRNLLDIMASDILNPVKSKYLFSPIFVKNTIDHFKFVVRPDEHISISI
jgi:hypothetical protein